MGDFLELLRADGFAERQVEMTINVDLSEVAAFMREVRAPRIFEIVAGFSKIVNTSTGFKIEVATKHWQRVSQKNWQDEPLQEMSHTIKKVERKTASFEKLLEGAMRPFLFPARRVPALEDEHTSEASDDRSKRVSIIV